jgi:hypothetical protein
MPDETAARRRRQLGKELSLQARRGEAVGEESGEPTRSNAEAPPGKTFLA